MAKILVGGPEGERKDAHDGLVTLLEQEHEVKYVKNDGQGMFWELARTPLVPANSRYDLVLYDSGLFFPAPELEKKVELFGGFVGDYLLKAQAPVIVLAEAEIAIKLRPEVEKIGFMQIDQPYNVSEVLHNINLLLAVNQK